MEGATVCFVFALKEWRGLGSTVFFVIAFREWGPFCSGWVEGVFAPKYCGVFLGRVEGATVCFVFAPKEKQGLGSTVFFVVIAFREWGPFCSGWVEGVFAPKYCRAFSEAS